MSVIQSFPPVNAEFTPPTQSSLSRLAGAESFDYYSGKMSFHTFTISSFVHCGGAAASASSAVKYDRVF